MSNAFGKITGAIAQALTGKPREFTVAKTMAAIAAASKTALASPEDLKALRALQKQHEEFGRLVLEHVDTKARADWTQQNKDVTAKMLAGTFDPEKDVWTLQDLCDDYHQRMESFKAAQCQVTQRSLPIAEKAAVAFAQLAEQLAADIEGDDQVLYGRFAVQYEPAPLVLRLRECGRIAVGWIAGCRTNTYSNISPRAMCPFLNI